jgi:hypothetical protein
MVHNGTQWYRKAANSSLYSAGIIELLAFWNVSPKGRKQLIVPKARSDCAEGSQ